MTPKFSINHWVIKDDSTDLKREYPFIGRIVKIIIETDCDGSRIYYHAVNRGPVQAFLEKDLQKILLPKRLKD